MCGFIYRIEWCAWKINCKMNIEEARD